MASIANDPAGRKRIIFYDKNGDRKAIRLGKCSKKTAEEVRTRVESLNTAIIAGVPSTATRPHGWASTTTNLLAGKRRLVAFFGADKPLADITPVDADAWLVWLKGGQFAEATIGKTVKWARQFFRAAVRKEILIRNPFADAKASSQIDEARKFFITLEVAYKVLEACPDAEWRLIFALSRFGGLRCPSEHLALTWPDVDWERDRFRVDSPKTGVRWVPIFPELRPYLEEAFEQAAEGSLYLVNRYRDTNQNLRTQLNRILRRAGLEPWPKLFHNLRASRQTELAAVHPLHVVCAWIGNTERVASKHYLQVTEADFDRAANSAPHSAFSSKTAQNPRATEHTPSTHGTKNPQIIPGFFGGNACFLRWKG